MTTQAKIDQAMIMLSRGSGAHYCELIQLLCDDRIDCQCVKCTLDAIRARGCKVADDGHRVWIEREGE